MPAMLRPAGVHQHQGASSSGRARPSDVSTHTGYVESKCVRFEPSTRDGSLTLNHKLLNQQQYRAPRSAAAQHAVYGCMRLITRMIAIMLGVGALLTLAWTGALVWVFYLLAMSSLS
jgi:hypothetical protein